MTTNLEREKILLVEDSEVQAMIIRNLLESENFHVVYKKNSIEALSYLSEIIPHDYPSLVITDYHMPEMDGLEFCKKIKTEISPELLILFLTIDRDENTIKLAFEAGASDYIRKPPVSIEFVARVRNLISLKNKMDEYKKALDEINKKNIEINQFSILDPLTEVCSRQFFIKALIEKVYDASR